MFNDSSTLFIGYATPSLAFTTMKFLSKLASDGRRRAVESGGRGALKHIS